MMFFYILLHFFCAGNLVYIDDFHDLCRLVEFNFCFEFSNSMLLRREKSIFLTKKNQFFDNIITFNAILWQ